MIILPCSQNTLAKCAVGIADSLITRAFYRNAKGKKRDCTAPRELPFKYNFAKKYVDTYQIWVLLLHLQF